MPINELVLARNTAGLTQRELGLRVLELTDNKGTEKSAQKKVSLWEGNHASPTDKEIEALSRILERSPDEVKSWFRKLPASATDLYRELSLLETPTLIAACYSGRPKAGFDPEVFRSLIAAVSNHVSFAMFFPFPTSPVPHGDVDTLSDLYDHYRTIWQAVRNRHEEIFMAMPASSKRSDQLALYKLEENNPNIIVPPSASRYTLVIKLLPDGVMEKTLYIWVESEDVEGFFRVGTFSDQPAQPQVTAWQAYFGPVIEAWLRDSKLPMEPAPWKQHISSLLLAKADFSQSSSGSS